MLHLDFWISFPLNFLLAIRTGDQKDPDLMPKLLVVIEIRPRSFEIILIKDLWAGRVFSPSLSGEKKEQKIDDGVDGLCEELVHARRQL